MKRPRDRHWIRVEDYARQTGIPPEELVGLIKTHYFNGELRDGEWFVESGSSRPKSTLGRLLWFMGSGFTLGAGASLSRVIEQDFSSSALLTASKWAFGCALAGAALFLLSKLHQFPENGQ